MPARVCHKLGIPYYLIDEAAEFQKQVIQYFADEYKAGRTPNPCVMCNQNLKFGRLISRADQLGAEYIATGHFARVEESRGRRAAFCSSADAIRARTRAISCSPCGRTNSPRAMFPLGEKTKSDTREVARQCQLKTADKEESMEICFVPDNDYGGFLQSANLVQKHRGEIVDLHGHVLGHHEGIEFYTIGQRKGLGITTPKPVYVVELDAETNRVVVGDDSALDRDEFVAERCNWHPFDATRRAHGSDGQDSLQPSRHAGDGDPASATTGAGEVAHAATRHHTRPGGGVLPGGSGGGWRVDRPLKARSSKIQNPSTRENSSSNPQTRFREDSH